MKTLKTVAGAALLTFGVAAPALSDSHDALVEFQVLAPKIAAELAMAGMDACEAGGFQVSVAVVDRFGVPQALVRNRFAGPHTPDTAIRKAWTSVSFRTDTLELADATKAGTAQSGARDISNALMLGGAVVIEVSGQMVGAVAVSGAPTGKDDEDCARAGIAAIEDKLPF